jgi:mannosyltransferase
VDAVAGIHNMKSRDIAIIVTTITIAGFLLRLYHLDWQCLTADELVTQKVSGFSSVLSVVFWSFQFNYNPPLYYIASYLSSLALGGVSLFSIRLPALVFGTLCIPSMYFLGKELHGKTHGLLLAVVSSFLFPFVYYSQNARAYSLVILVFIWFVVYFIKLYKGDTKSKTTILFFVFAALCLWSHFYSIVPLVVSFAVLIEKRHRVLMYVIPMVVVLVAPCIIYKDAILYHLSAYQSSPHNMFWFNEQQMATMIPNELFCWSWIVIIPLAAYTIYRFRNDLHISLVGISSLSVLFCVFPLTHFTSASPRYTLLVSPVVLAVAIYPVSLWIDSLKTLDRKIVIFIAFVFVVFLFNYGSLLSWYTFNICPYLW